VGIIRGLSVGIISENYQLVYHHAEKLRFIGILAYPKITTLKVSCLDKQREDIRETLKYLLKRPGIRIRRNLLGGSG
jgi:hypothetical protein